MSGTLGIVEVPASTRRPLASSAKLPPLAARRFGDQSLLEWVVRRVTDSLMLDQVAVLAEASWESTIQSLAPADATVFASQQPDALGRFAAAARQSAIASRDVEMSPNSSR